MQKTLHMILQGINLTSIKTDSIDYAYEKAVFIIYIFCGMSMKIKFCSHLNFLHLIQTLTRGENSLPIFSPNGNPKRVDVLGVKSRKM